MINGIWLILILVGIVVSLANGTPEVITDTALTAAGVSVKYAFELIGIMAFWLGIMKVAEEAGLINLFAKLIRPFTRRLFPSVPSDHPALGSILLNVSANVLGLGNAATPFGLKAMQELQELNKDKDEASDAMITFMALNTSCIVIIPATIIGIRLAAGSANPTEIVGTTLMATCIGMTVALTVDWLIRTINNKRQKG